MNKCHKVSLLAEGLHLILVDFGSDGWCQRDISWRLHDSREMVVSSIPTVVMDVPKKTFSTTSVPVKIDIGKHGSPQMVSGATQPSSYPAP